MILDVVGFSMINKFWSEDETKRMFIKIEAVFVKFVVKIHRLILT